MKKMHEQFLKKNSGVAWSRSSDDAIRDGLLPSLSSASLCSNSNLSIKHCPVVERQLPGAPILITPRPAEQGASFSLTNGTQVLAWLLVVQTELAVIAARDMWGSDWPGLSHMTILVIGSGVSIT